jgi:hypothetical protein
MEEPTMGTGRFSITATVTETDEEKGEPVEVVAFAEDCVPGEFCTDEGARSIPSGSTVTIAVTVEQGSVGAGSLD